MGGTTHVTITDQEKYLCELLVQGIQKSEAYDQAGYTRSSGPTIMKKPRVAEYLATLKAKTVEVETNVLADVIGKRRAVSRTDVMLRLTDLMNLDPEETNKNITGQVKAASELAEILGMKIKQVRDVTRTFEGWTEEELEEYSRNGTVPDRFRDPGCGA